MNHNAEGQATLTRPGRAARAADGTGTVQPHHREQHRKVNWLRDVYSSLTLAATGARTG